MPLGKIFDDTPSTLAENASPDPMFAGPEKELLTIMCFSESAFPGEFLSKHLFFGLECLSTRAISEATTVL